MQADLVVALNKSMLCSGRCFTKIFICFLLILLLFLDKKQLQNVKTKPCLYLKEKIVILLCIARLPHYRYSERKNSYSMLLKVETPYHDLIMTRIISPQSG
jgi:hypothetical protein